MHICRRFFLFAIIFVLFPTLTAFGADTVFKMHMYKELENGVQVVFRDESRMRMITFMGSQKQFAIKLPDRKAIIDWQDVQELQYRDARDKKGVMVVVLKGRSKTFDGDFIEFGELGCSDWSKLVSRFEGELSFSKIN